MPDIQVRETPGYDGKEIIIRVGRDEMMGGKLDLTAAMQEGAKEIAKAYIEENVSAIMGKMDPAAVANLAIAESAKLIRQQFIDPTPPVVKKSKFEGKEI